MRTTLACLLIGSSLLAVGCMSNSASGPDSVAAAVDSQEGTEDEGNMMMATTEGADGAVAAGPGAPLLATDVAATIAANVATRWSPSTCATVTTNGPDVDIKFDDCTGPRGLLHVTGELDLVVSINTSGAIAVTGTATGLQVNNATLDINLTATYATSGTNDVLTVDTMGAGTGPLGNAIDHSGNYTVTWDTTSQCGSIDGMWSTELTSSTTSRTRGNMVDVSRCAGGCPTGTMVHDFLTSETLTITFDGTPTASWALSTGKTGSFALACQ
jgi:hypothetical protein